MARTPIDPNLLWSEKAARRANLDSYPELFHSIQQTLQAQKVAPRYHRFLANVWIEYLDLALDETDSLDLGEDLLPKNKTIGDLWRRWMRAEDASWCMKPSHIEFPAETLLAGKDALDLPLKVRIVKTPEGYRAVRS